MFDLITEWSTDRDCYLSVNQYSVDGSLCLQVVNDEDGLICTLTVYLGEVPNNRAYLDTNNCYWAEKLIKDLGIGFFTGKRCISGYCIYPLYEFDMNKIKEYTRNEVNL